MKNRNKLKKHEMADMVEILKEYFKAFGSRQSSNLSIKYYSY
ncbi:MAG TPA: hypothetical protein VIM70_03580 [Clostridium sp.]